MWALWSAEPWDVAVFGLQRSANALRITTKTKPSRFDFLLTADAAGSYKAFFKLAGVVEAGPVIPERLLAKSSRGGLCCPKNAHVHDQTWSNMIKHDQTWSNMIKHAYIATILSFQFSKTPPRHLPPPPHQLSTGTSLGISGWMHQSPVISVSGCSEVETHQQTASNPLHIETYRNCFSNWATKKIKNQKPRQHKKTTKRYKPLQRLLWRCRMPWSCWVTELLDEMPCASSALSNSHMQRIVSGWTWCTTSQTVQGHHGHKFQDVFRSPWKFLG